MASIKFKDQNGNWIKIKGVEGPKGATGATGATGIVSSSDINNAISTSDSINAAGKLIDLSKIINRSDFLGIINNLNIGLMSIIDNEMFFYCNRNYNGYVKGLYCISFTTGRVKFVSTCPNYNKNGLPTVIASKNYIYIPLDYYSLDKIHIYNRNTNTWTMSSPHGFGTIDGGEVFKFEDSVYIARPIATTPKDVAYIYNTKTDTWTQKPLPYTGYHSYTANDGKLIAIQEKAGSTTDANGYRTCEYVFKNLDDDLKVTNEIKTKPLPTIDNKGLVSGYKHTFDGRTLVSPFQHHQKKMTQRIFNVLVNDLKHDGEWKIACKNKFADFDDFSEQEIYGAEICCDLNYEKSTKLFLSDKLGEKDFFFTIYDRDFSVESVETKNKIIDMKEEIKSIKNGGTIYEEFIVVDAGKQEINIPFYDPAIHRIELYDYSNDCFLFEENNFLIDNKVIHVPIYSNQNILYKVVGKVK